MTAANKQFNLEEGKTNTSANAAFSTGAIVTPFSGKIARLTVREPGYAWHADVQSKLQELISLPMGWDGYRGKPVAFQIAIFGIKLLETVCVSDTPAPQLLPGAGGELQIEWHTNQIDIEIYIRAPNDVHVWYRDETTPDDGLEAVYANDFRELLTQIKKLH